MLHNHSYSYFHDLWLTLLLYRLGKARLLRPDAPLWPWWPQPGKTRSSRQSQMAQEGPRGIFHLTLHLCSAAPQESNGKATDSEEFWENVDFPSSDPVGPLIGPHKIGSGFAQKYPDSRSQGWWTRRMLFNLTWQGKLITSWWNTNSIETITRKVSTLKVSWASRDGATARPAPGAGPGLLQLHSTQA